MGGLPWSYWNWLIADLIIKSVECRTRSLESTPGSNGPIERFPTSNTQVKSPANTATLILNDCASRPVYGPMGQFAQKQCMQNVILPNTSFQRTLTRGGFGPLNSDR
jgi:hypothetical protein